LFLITTYWSSITLKSGVKTEQFFMIRSALYSIFSIISSVDGLNENRGAAASLSNFFLE
jgi:hypothetical protein